MRTERWWWLAGFLFLSVLIHVLLALHGPGFGLNGVAPSPTQIELTLEPLPPPEKPNKKPPVTPKIKIARTPKVAVKPAMKRPVMHTAVAQAAPKPQIVPMKPAAAVTLPEDEPQTVASAQTDAPHLRRSESAPVGKADGASGGSSAAPTEQPSDTGLAGGMHFPKLAARIGGQSVLSVKNPLAEDAVPEDTPGFSAGAGGGPGIGSGRGNGGMSGKLLASLHGSAPGLGGGGTGRGKGVGHGAGEGADLPTASGDGYGRMGVGIGPGSGGSGAGGSLRVVGGGGAFGGIGGLLRGEPARAAGDGRPGGNGHGLSAEIYEGRPYLTKLIGHRTDAGIDFNWGMTAAVIPGASRIFSVRWTGKIKPQYSELYKFDSQEDDGLRLWVDGQPLITDWEDHKLTSQSGSLHLEAGRKYEIRIEYFNGPEHAKNGLGHAEVHLRWSSPSQPLEIIPESALFQRQ